jgi:selenide,water dikinase
VLEGVRDAADAGLVPGGTRDNLEHAGARVEWDAGIAPVERLVLCDAQTSGGLLISLPEAAAPGLLAALRQAGVVDATRIGTITGRGAGRIRVRRTGEGRDTNDGVGTR